MKDKKYNCSSSSYKHNRKSLYKCFLLQKIGLNTTIIHPASQKHLDKFSRKELYIVNETYETYQNITLPHIEANKFSLEVGNKLFEHILHKLIFSTYEGKHFSSG